MKKQNLQSADDNIISMFYKDSIGRNKDLVYFIKIIDSIDAVVVSVTISSTYVVVVVSTCFIIFPSSSISPQPVVLKLPQ